MNRRVQLCCAWSGIPFVLLFACGFVVLARFVPPPAPTLGAGEIVALYRGNLNGIRTGLVLAMVGATPMLPWGLAIVEETRRSEAGRPLLTHLQVAAVAANTVFFFLDMMIYAVAAFRPGQVSPEITRTLNDFAWFGLLMPWPPATLWMGAVGVAILRDDSDEPVYPRWAAVSVLLVRFSAVPRGFPAVLQSRSVRLGRSDHVVRAVIRLLRLGRRDVSIHDPGERPFRAVDLVI
jgi:hypothetical protein